MLHWVKCLFKVDKKRDVAIEKWAHSFNCTPTLLYMYMYMHLADALVIVIILLL